MAKPNGVTGEVADPEQDDRGVPLKNLQAEMTRKLEEMERKTSEQIGQLTAKLSELLQPDTSTPAPDRSNDKYDPRQELQSISRDPRRYVEEFVEPLRKENEQLKGQVQEVWKQAMRSRWERMEGVLAAREGKKDWSELPKDVQDGIIATIKSNGWETQPERALSAYNQWKADRAQKLEGEPDRLERVNAQPEGSGRPFGKVAHRSLTSEQIEQMSHTMPTDPNYKANMELLGKVQSGEIKIE